MADKLPKLEGRFTVTTAWTATVSDTAQATVTVLPAGDYYWTSATSALTTIANALTNDGTLTGAYTATLDDDADTSLGKITIACNKNFVLTWAGGAPDPAVATGTNTFTTPATSTTGTRQARYLWLPNCGRSESMAPDGNLGAGESDLTVTMSPSGSTRAYYYNQRWVDVYGFGFIKGSKTWITKEATTNESLQRFIVETTMKGAPFRYHVSRDTDGTFVTNRADAETGGVFKPTPVDPNWRSGANSLWSWSVNVRRLV